MKQGIKYIGMIFLFIFMNTNSLFAQEKSKIVEGYVSFISSQNVYIRFESTQDIKQGDTIYSFSNNQYVASLIVYDFSSISCICKPLNENILSINDKVFANIPLKTSSFTAKIDDTSLHDSILQSYVSKPELGTDSSYKIKPGLVGRISAATFSCISNENVNDYLRMRYTVFMKAEKIGNTNFSAENYIIFTHRKNEWNEIKSNVYSGLKVYNLAIKYAAKSKTNFVLGRNINEQIANIGAIDGLQIQQQISKFKFGIIGGSMPDHFDYRFNKDLIQMGGFVSHKVENNSKFYQSSVAFMEQKNKTFTDRRFLYFQHSNNLFKNIYTFLSLELNLYKVENLIPKNTLDISSIYLMFRYNYSAKLSISASYDKRTNVIYYETYKNYLDKLIEDEFRQGVTGSLHYKKSKWTNMGIKTSISYRKDDSSPMENVAFYINFLQTPIKAAEINITSNFINTNYLLGSMTGFLITKELKPAKLFLGVQYRIFLGKYNFSNVFSNQHLADLQLNWKIYKNLQLSTSVDLFIEKKFVSNRINLILTKRF